MAEYIEREEINKAMKEVCDDPSCPMHVAAEIAQIIDCAPAADVVPVVYGKWVHPHWGYSGNFCYNCSVCGNEAMHKEYKWADKKFYPICPWCGAKMRENNET